MKIKDAAQHLHNATKRIRELEQQRAELLEALKKCRFDSLNMSIEDLRFIQENITKAEAAE